MPDQPTHHALVEPRRTLFDLAGSAGLNESERILAQLCQKSFLRLWSQTNVFTDEGFKDGKGSTRELCDALVVFGNDVIIFSDKHIPFQSDKALEVAWPRWYKRAIFSSCKQLHGAKSWLKRFPSRAYLDPKCVRPLPVAIPTTGVRFHLVAVTRGSREAVLAQNEGEGLGSFGLNSAIEGNEHFNSPFMVGLPEPTKHFVHVFDEVSIELLLAELDTAADFLEYLKKREALLGRRGTHVIAFGEEELLSAYLLNMDPAGQEHVFMNIPGEGGLPDAVVFAQGFYDTLQDEQGYRRKKLADKVSYLWDELIEKFLEFGDTRLFENFAEQPATETELGLRLMAAEPRFRRRQLAGALLGAMQRAEPGLRLSRLVSSGLVGETVYVLLVAPLHKGETYAAYRQRRIAELYAYVQTAKLVAPVGTTFVGLAVDNPHREYRGTSEDLFVLKKDSWSAEELLQLENMRRELRIWGEAMEYSRYRQDEFPQEGQAVAIQRVKAPVAAISPVAKNGRKKNDDARRKMQKASRRRNRGRS